MKYALILNTRGIEEVVDVSNDFEEISLKEKALQKECRRVDPEGVEIGCYVRTDEEDKRIAEFNAFWDTLTDEQKKETITIDGKIYAKIPWEHFNK